MPTAIARQAADPITGKGAGQPRPARLNATELSAAVRVREYWANRHASIRLPSANAPAARPDGL